MTKSNQELDASFKPFRLAFRAKLGLVVAPLVLAGCVVSPQPFSVDTLEAKSTEQLHSYLMEQDAINGPIGLYEAMARAIKYNLDDKVEQLEKMLRTRELQLERHDMLPDLLVNAGYNGRSNYSGASSSRLLSKKSIGEQSLVASTSSERETLSGDLLLSWDLLDFGLSYVRAKQKADEVLIANERRRKVVSRIIEDVRTAFWRAVSAERLMSELKVLEADIEGALSHSQSVVNRRRAAPLSALTYQRELLSTKEDIQDLQREMSVAKHQLAALMNIDPGEPFVLAMPQRSLAGISFDMDPQQMVSMALQNRPEIRENLYRQRINEKAASTALLELLPSLRLFGGFNYDDNEFLFTDQWTGWGARTSWNLLQAFSYPAKRRSVKAQQDLLEGRAKALTMAVITQVHVSRTRFEHARHQVDTMSNFYRVQSSILEQIKAGFSSERVSKQTMIRERMNKLVAEAKYDLAVADLQNAFANINASMGLDPYGSGVSGQEPVMDLAQKLQQHWENRGDGISFTNGQENASQAYAGASK